MIFKCLALLFFLLNFSHCLGQQKFHKITIATYGGENTYVADIIQAANTKSDLFKNAQFEKLKNLLNSEIKHPLGNFSNIRSHNEFSNLLSNHIFDIEEAIHLDEKINSLNDSDEYLGMNLVEKNNFISDVDYYKNFLKITSTEIRRKSIIRRDKNIQLLTGNLINDKLYDIAYLLRQKSAAHIDLEKSSQSDNFHHVNKIKSRLIRVEHELMKHGAVTPTAWKYFIDNEDFINNFDFNEATFLQLADYLKSTYKISKNKKLLEIALSVIYKPYINLGNPKNRWGYNKLINIFIEDLIDANYKENSFSEMLYYIGLNKSRMLLEERLAFSGSKQVQNMKLADLIADDAIPRDSVGLPDKVWFKHQLANTPQFLDFYASGNYQPISASDSVASKGARSNRSLMPLDSRNATQFVVGEAAAEIDVFQDDALYITQVEGGRVVKATKVSGVQLKALKDQLEKSYAEITDDNISKQAEVARSPELRALLGTVGRSFNGEKLLVSPDKWMAKHPMDFHLGVKVVRSVNFFTAENTGKLNKLSVTGFFNPALVGGEGSLAGADQEALSIKSILPSATIVRHENANKAALQNAGSANVIHLSMHGSFNAQDAKQSKLLFAGSKYDGSTGDSYALYASDMAGIEALRNRDLIFAAACQTGLSAADRSNENELVGMLRPLTANRNRNVILSLWSVNDKVTGEFVQSFYQQLAATQDVTVSFHSAQDAIKAKYPHPFFWSAFYLSQSK